MKLWGGRFSAGPNEAMYELNRSIRFDQRLWKADLEGSIAWARELHAVGLLSTEEVTTIVEGLRRVKEEWERGTFEILDGDEDIHTANERRLSELIGEPGRKLHTGRSRNDQVATDLRIYLREELEVLDRTLREMQEVLVARAREELDLIMPGYTHLQHAQPVRWSHWLLQWVWMLQRDRERLADTARRANRSPLGAGALAGNSLGVDRERLAAALGFDSVIPNSLDAVSDRDFVLESLATMAILGTHLSRLAEDLILFASAEFGFVRLDNRFTTGSSLMPQKANPDALELARGKSGRLTGNLVTLLVVVKGLPSSYNKDLQEDKEALFDSLDTLSALLPVLVEVLRTLRPNGERMREVLDAAMLATDLADHLVRKGVPFREAHHLVGRAVAASEERGVPLSALPLEVYRAIHEGFDESLYELFDFDRSVDARGSTGGPGREAVEAQLARAAALLSD